MVRVAVTGHRPDKLGGYNATENFKAIRRHMRDFLEDAPQGELWLLSGGALGVDQFWIEVGLHLQLPVIAVLPFKGYDSKWPVASRQYYEKLLAQCQEVRYLDTGYKPESYQKRNEFLVDDCDVLVAYWNGEESGTQNCIDYAISQNKTINLFNTEDIIKNA
jgi:uncharacterized phage-like protein YoqJ